MTRCRRIGVCRGGIGASLMVPSDSGSSEEDGPLGGRAASPGAGHGGERRQPPRAGRRGWRPPRRGMGRGECRAAEWACAPPATCPLGPARAPPHVAQTPPRARRAAERPRSFPSAACAGAKQPGHLRTRSYPTRSPAWNREARGLPEPLGSPPTTRSAVLSPTHPPTSQNHRPDEKGQPRDPTAAGLGLFCFC